MTVFLFVSLLVMLAASVPIFIALCGSVTASFLLFSNMDTTIIIQRMFAGINKFSLMSIPLFVLAANLMSEGGISKRIINLANAFVGHIPGGLGMTAILASMFFGAISGSSPATVVAIGALLYPAMIEKGYSRCHHRGRLSGYHHPTFCKHDRLRNCNRRFCWSPVYVRFRRRYRIRTQLCGIYLFLRKTSSGDPA